MKKSIVISLMAVTILFCTAVYTFASTGIVTTDTLRVRKDATTEASIVALLSMNDKIEILGEKDGWYKISATINGKKVQGYVSEKYVKVEKTEEPAKNETSKPKEEEPAANEVVSAETSVKKEETNTKENEAGNEEKSQEEKMTVKTLPAQTKIYITPVVNSLIINTLEEEKIVEITSEVNGWSYVTTGDIKGWVRTGSIAEKEISKTEQKTSSQKTGYISGNSVSLREEATTSANVILKLLRNSKINVISEENGWAKVEYNGKTGYVIAKYISDEKVTVTSRSTDTRTKNTTKTTTTTETKSQNKPVAKTGKGATGSEIVAFAKKYLGSKYVYGGSSPSGFDCSGFTSYVYKNFGYSLTRTSSGQSSQGKSVSKSELQPGDLVFFSKSSGSKKIGHVGIYIGGGQFIHAANTRKGVIISNISGSGFYYVSARRVI